MKNAMETLELDLGLDLGLGFAPVAVRKLARRRPRPACGHAAPPWAPVIDLAIRCPSCCMHAYADLAARAYCLDRAERGGDPKLTGHPEQVAAATAIRKEALIELEASIQRAAPKLCTSDLLLTARSEIVLRRGLLRRAVAVRQTRAAWWLNLEDSLRLPPLAELPCATAAEVVLDAELASALAEFAALAEEDRQARVAARQSPYVSPLGQEWEIRSLQSTASRAFAWAGGATPVE